MNENLSQKFKNKTLNNNISYITIKWYIEENESYVDKNDEFYDDTHKNVHENLKWNDENDLLYQKSHSHEQFVW